jgi:ATP-dependent protease Clp ATPase subunit
VKQYQKFFRMENSEVEFTPGALELIAERALKRDTGARALRAVCEEIMLDLMYACPTRARAANTSSPKPWSKAGRPSSSSSPSTADPAA